MKKPFITALLILSTCVGKSQSFTFKQLLDMCNSKSPEILLKSKSFKTINNPTFDWERNRYFLNKGTRKEEGIRTGQLEVDYMTTDSAFIKSLVKQAQKYYPLIIEGQERDFHFYHLGNTQVVIQVNINKKFLHTFSIHYKDGKNRK